MQRDFYLRLGPGVGQAGLPTSRSSEGESRMSVGGGDPYPEIVGSEGDLRYNI